MNRPRIKICGLTRPEDISLISELGIDMAGFIFVPASPRYLIPEQAELLVRELPPQVKRVGVFVDEEPMAVRKTAKQLKLDILQFHGDEAPDYCRQFKIPFFKAFRVRGSLDLNSLRTYRAKAILLDSFSSGARGGTGKTFDWKLARAAMGKGIPIILAGGLTPENAAKAVRTVKPWGLDVSSGVESAPGIKDHEKVRNFVKVVRAEK